MMVPKISQEDLGAALGITFQQIQKYEKGINRMSAAMMVQIAAVLKVDVQYFFDELPTGAKNAKEIKTPILIDMSLAAHGPRLIDAFLKLKTDKLRVRSPISRRKAEAEAVLAAAQRMPEGPKRIVALKKAGQLRFRADQRRRAIRDQEMELAAKSRLET
jgi:transcriptional regulator with XRE-family HTH domain